MDQAQTDKTVAGGSRINIGRVRIGLAVHKGDPTPTFPLSTSWPPC